MATRFHIPHKERVRIALRRARRARLALNGNASLDALLEFDSATAELHRLRANPQPLQGRC